MKPIEKLSVLVHPHYDQVAHFSGRGYVDTKTWYYPDTFPGGNKWVTLPKRRVKQIMSFSNPANKNFEPTREAIDKFYRHEITRISKIPGQHLVIATSTFSNLLVNLPDKPGLERKSLQDDLIQFARKKLGKRLIVFTRDHLNLGKDLPFWFQNPLPIDLPIEVFGEYSGACLDQTAEGLKQNGFSNVKIARGKSVWAHQR